MTHRLAGASRLRAWRVGLHPSIDPIGPKAEGAARAWVNYVFSEEAPEVVCAWEQGDRSSILLFGPVDPKSGLPKGMLPAGSALGVTFKLHERSPPEEPWGQLVVAEVSGDRPPRTSPTPKAASDGVLVPFGHTPDGVLYLPLLGPSGAGTMAFSGEGAPELLASLLLHAAARIGQGNIRALVYEDLRDHVSGIANLQTFGAKDLEAVRLELEEEWKKRKAVFTAARVEDIATYALLPDVEPFPVVILLVGAQAAGDMGLTDPTWAYVLQEAGRVGITTLVWGEVPTAPRTVHAGLNEGVAVIAGRRPDETSYTLPPVRFAPAVLSPGVHAEAAAVLTTAAPAAAGTAPVEPEGSAEAATPEHIPEEPATTVAEPPPREAVAIKAPVRPERAIYCLGGLRVEYKGVVVERWRRRNAQHLLAFLVAFEEGRSQDAVLEEIWPEGQPANARKGLNQLVSEVRRKLGGDRKHTPLIIVTGDRYRIDWNHMWADVRAFRDALAAAQSADDPVPHLKEAVELYRGDFCKDAYFGSTEDVRYELERAYIDNVLKLTEILIERGAIEEAHPIVDRALVVDPYSDALVRHGIGLDARRVGRAAALERFRRFRAALIEIGVEPEPETLSLIASLRESEGQ